MSDRAAKLRQAFDRSFALAPNAGIGTLEGLLAVRIGSTPYAVRLTEVSGLFVDRKITWLPSHVPALLGIAGLRGTVLPVYDLGMLLGFPAAAAARWVLVAAATPLGLAFEGFDGYLSARPEAIVPAVRAGAREEHVREILQTEVARPVIHLASVLETIRNRGGRDKVDPTE